jgi:hypothetical protein
LSAPYEIETAIAFSSLQWLFYLSTSMKMLLFFFNLLGRLFLDRRGFLLICLGVGYASFELYQTPITWTKKSNWLSYSRIINWG